MKLYVKYPNCEWVEFVQSAENIHQKLALDKFIDSKQEIMEISVPYNDWVFSATFKKIQLKNNTLYFYNRIDKKTVQFIYLDDNFIYSGYDFNKLNNTKQHFI